jgi:hypothetical protein
MVSDVAFSYCLSKQSSSSPCKRQSETRIECTFPGVPASITPRRRRRKRQASDTDAREYDVEIHLDGFSKILPARTLYVGDPILVGNRTISFDPDEQQDIVLSVIIVMEKMYQAQQIKFMFML